MRQSIPSRTSFKPAALALVLMLTASVTLTGCIRSRVHITSEPSGAEVIWRGEPRGATPITIPFIWYWYYDYAIEKPGYQRLEVTERLRTRPWFLFPLDLVMEVLPVPIPDNRYRNYVLKPLPESEGQATEP